MTEATRQKYLEKIEAVEGCEFNMYMLEKVPHIAIGHNIVSRPLTDETMDYLGIEDESELMHVTLDRDKCEYLFFKDLDIAVNDAKNLINNCGDGVTLDVFDALTEERQEVLVDMSFNLGRPRFSKFKKLIAAVRAGDYDEAAAQILDSKAARDPLTANRYADLAERMKGQPVHPPPDGNEYSDPFVEIQDSVAASELKKFSGLQLLEELTRREKERG